jgi:hypothetical protein
MEAARSGHAIGYRFMNQSFDETLPDRTACWKNCLDIFCIAVLHVSTIYLAIIAEQRPKLA